MSADQHSFSEPKGSVVVTGVSSGIGAAISRHLVSVGYFVFGSVRSEADASSLKESLGDQFQPLVFDVRDREKVNEAAKMVEQRLNGTPLRGLINNAGLAAFGPLENLDDDTFERTIAVNLLGSRIVTNAFIPALRGTDENPPGKIINLSSLSGILNTPMNGAYCVAKHALESLAEVYRRELLPDGIDVVSIRSGPVQSEIWNKNKTESSNVVYEQPAYQKMARKAAKIMVAAERDAIPANDIALATQKILERTKNRTAYHFGKGAVVSRILSCLPSRFADRLITGSLMKTKKQPS